MDKSLHYYNNILLDGIKNEFTIIYIIIYFPASLLKVSSGVVVFRYDLTLPLGDFYQFGFFLKTHSNTMCFFNNKYG